ncbi:hypothetical protein SJAG_04422 [Schizosaccharomyces japonicus yFS275]|uniref:ATPase inhibitor, mitochondrial n=1 Tax=Schizosaccharomyces japonicus (strain yFS275 / FY16936) TaxID=402676 RepID=B6K6T3_SCHJY|nr:hypothetical protein SJAG_04422 [Schizosaccharomyces japonicus yFS275]EEB09237.1 hypothetical protein SJAG_04422 [Schizosaccharomyces japonicus yFS275]
MLLLRFHRPASKSVVRFARYTSSGSFNNSPFSGPVVEPDPFKEREKTKEDYFVHQQELEKLRRLKRSLQQHRKELDQIEQRVNSLTQKHEEQMPSSTENKDDESKEKTRP